MLRTRSERHLLDFLLIRCAFIIAGLSAGCSDKHGSREGQVQQQQAPLTSFNGTAWYPIGPAPQKSGQTYGKIKPDLLMNAGPTRAGRFSGRASSVAANPAHPSEVYLGTANGGLWHTNDVLAADVLWEPISDALPSFAIGSIALEGCTANPTNACGKLTTCGCSRIWVGTGENAIRRDTYYGRGVYLMKDRGTHGDVSTENFEFAPVGDSETSLKYGSIARLLPFADFPTTGHSTTFAAVASGVASNGTHSSVLAPPPPAGYGIYQSADEGPWTKLTVSDAAPAPPTSLEIVSSGATKTMFAGFLGKGLYRSTDSGVSWCRMNGVDAAAPTCSGVTGLPSLTTSASGFASFSSVQIAVAPSSPQVLYAMFGQCEQPGPAAGIAALNATNAGATTDTGCGNTAGMFLSTNGGTVWSALTLDGNLDVTELDRTFPTFHGYPRYTHVITVDPNDPNVFLFGGTVLERCAAAGSAAYHCRAQGNQYAHPDHHAIIFPDAANALKVYDVNDGGFAYSLDGANTFVNANDNLPISQFHSIATHPALDAILGGMQDNGWSFFTGTKVWDHYFGIGGDGGGAVLDSVGGVPVAYVAGTPDPTGPSLRVTRVDQTNSLTALPLPTTTAGILRMPFYPALHQHLTTRDLYFGADQLLKSTDTGTGPRGSAWTALSPADLAAAGSAILDIERTGNTITAVGIAPSDARRVYLGFYNGQVFGSVASGPCVTTSCWTQLAGAPATTNVALPGLPVTSIAVDPTNPVKIYVAYSGFGAPSHVFSNATATPGGWSTFSGGALAGLDVPANVLAIEPSHPESVWLGTDQGIFRTQADGLWHPESFFTSNSMPRVPVYDLSIDEAHHRVIAGTHGRGAWALTAPTVVTEEGWVVMNGVSNIWDIPIFGYGFQNSSGHPEPCTVELIQQSGRSCVTSGTDAVGGLVQIAVDGTLQTSQGGSYDGKPVVWGCNNHLCLRGQSGTPTPINQCITQGGVGPGADPVSLVRVVCNDATFGTQVAVAQVHGAPNLASPPSNIFSVDPPGDPGSPFSGSFDLLASLQVAAGGSRVLCSVSVPFSDADTPAAVVGRATSLINGDPTCAGQGVLAVATGTHLDEEEDSDGFPFLVLKAPGLTGTQLVASARVAPHLATNHTFYIGNLGLPLMHELLIGRVTILSDTSGALGGTLIIREQSKVGTCQHAVVTHAGDSPTTIAAAIDAAFETSTTPGTIECPANQNPFDLVAEGPSIITVMASGLSVTSTDPGVGFTFTPEEVAIGPDANLSSLAVYATDTLTIDDRVVLREGTSSFARLASSGVGMTSVGSRAMTGDVLSQGPIFLRDSSTINGLVRTASTVTRQNSVVVTGPVVEHSPLQLPPLALHVAFPATTTDVLLANDQSRSLVPGAYRNATVNARAKLALRAGTYYFTSLDLESTATLTADESAGPVYIFVQSSLIFRATFVPSVADGSKTLLGYLGTNTVAIETPFAGTLIAPSSSIHVGSVAPTVNSGAFFAKTVELHADSTVRHIPFAGTIP